MIESPTSVEIVADAIGCGDMGPGVSLRAVLISGMAHYYDGDRAKAAKCVEWALRQAARRAARSLIGGE